MNSEQKDKKTLLVFNCHEPWVYQLGSLGFNLDIIIGLKGRYTSRWDEQMRPVPQNGRLISLSEALESKTEYYCIITHNTTDLLDVKSRNEPKIIVLHSSLEGRVQEEQAQSAADSEKLRDILHKYITATGTHTVATSMFKGESWGLTEDIVVFGTDAEEYLPHTGEEACGLRVCNFIENRRKILMWDFHEQAFAGLPVRLVGHNPTLPGVSAAANWDELKKIIKSHRFYIHTADPQFESGFNMASIEAMAGGMPVLGNRHPTSPIKHGVNGFLSDNPEELRKFAKILLADKELANLMGQKARKTAIEQFSISRFAWSFNLSIEKARSKWQQKREMNSPPSRINSAVL
jgi:glycosyltransferase involved in cell wall biosynthesis